MELMTENVTLGRASRKDGYDGNGTDPIPRAGGEPVVSLVHYQRGGSLPIAASDLIMDASVSAGV
jgi:hypothetical protein